jgi:hypothetical protein
MTFMAHDDDGGMEVAEEPLSRGIAYQNQNEIVQRSLFRRLGYSCRTLYSIIFLLDYCC